MNHLPNGAIAVGAPGSQMRAKAEQEDAALGIIQAEYASKPDRSLLAINQDCNAIGAWDPAQERFVMVAAYAITGQWVSMPYELLVNGKRLEHSWRPIPKPSDLEGGDCQHTDTFKVSDGMINVLRCAACGTNLPKGGR